MPTDTTPAKILFAEEVAERLGRSINSFRHMIKSGTAPKSARIGGRLCWRESDVEAFIAAAFEDAT